MSTLTTTIGGFATSHVGADAERGTFLNGVKSLFKGASDKTAALSELQNLSDHMLADIGLSRGDLPYAFDAEVEKMRRELGVRGL